MSYTPIIAPSMLSADFGALDRDVEMVNRSQAGWFHLDIMDGTFVPNISFGFPVVKAIARNARKPMDAHLMIVHPEKYIARFAEAGVEYLSVHYEACEDLDAVLSLVHSCGMKAGVAICPETPAQVLEGHLGKMDFVLVMSVHPGFGGQKFIEDSIAKVACVREMIAREGASCLIEVDGGVGADNIPALARAGVTAFVAGSSVFSTPEPEQTIASFLRQASEAQMM